MASKDVLVLTIAFGLFASIGASTSVSSLKQTLGRLSLAHGEAEATGKVSDIDVVVGLIDKMTRDLASMRKELVTLSSKYCHS